MILLLLTNQQISFFGYIYGYFTGGYGPGGYFMLILIQAILVTPIIYKIMKDNHNSGLVIMFVISTLLELICKIFNVDPGLYRLLIVRYIFAIAIGIWIAKNKKTKNYLWILILSVVSIAYITSVQYFGKVYITEYMWTAEHAPAYFYVAILVYIGLNFFDLSKLGKSGLILTSIGKRSYYIYLAQMLYFMLPISYSNSNLVMILQVLLGFVVCITGGFVLEYFYESISFIK